jgi:repressor LexA
MESGKKMTNLPEKQRRILEFIQSQHVQTGIYPSVREIALHMDFKSTNTVDYHLRRLEERGVLERGNRRARSFAVPDMKRGGKGAAGKRVEFSLPIIGRVAAGQPILAEQNYHGMVNFRTFFHCDDQTFALKVQGDSMVNAGIVDGDLVIVRREGKVDNGTIAVAVIGEEATVKRIFDEGTYWRLQPENPTMKPIQVKKDESMFCIAGKVIGVIRKI